MASTVGVCGCAYGWFWSRGQNKLTIIVVVQGQAENLLLIAVVRTIVWRHTACKVFLEAVMQSALYRKSVTVTDR